MDVKNLSFKKDADQEFIKALRKKVRNYFKQNNVTRYANANMVVKTVFMISLYLVPYFLMLFGVVTNVWAMTFMWVLMAFGMSGIGFSVMHDANHGSYSKHQWVNKALGQIIKLVGGSAENWKIQHNVLHHTYTNIPGMDEDIEIGNIMRFSPEQERKWYHRLQHFYAWFLYGLMTLMWSTTKDFKQLKRYHERGLTQTTNRSIRSLYVDLILSKLGYYLVFLVVPMVFFAAAWWQVLLMYVLMHYVAGLILSMVFQPAHVAPHSEFPTPDDEGLIDNHWAIHQVATTCNFAPKSKFFSWYVGGLNYQIEHHLFPNICHIHYEKLSRIVSETAQEYGLPYYSEKTFFSALRQHAKMLRDLGKFDQLEKVAA